MQQSTDRLWKMRAIVNQKSEEFNALSPDSCERISLRGCAVNGQKENPLARRRYQRGHVFFKKRQNGGVWVGRYKEDVLVDGAVKRVKRAVVLGDVRQYRTKRLALRALEARLSIVNNLAYRAQPRATFEEFTERWVIDVVSQFKPSTACNYRLHIRKHLNPFFGREQLRDIGSEMVQRFVAQQHGSPKTVRNIIVTLRALWRSARAWRYVTNDIFDGLVLPKARAEQRYFFSSDDVKRIVSAAEEPHRTFYGLLAETGLRVGELCALTLDDLNLERCFLRVRHSAWRGKLGSPKTERSVRVVDLSKECVAHLTVFLKSWHPNERRLLFATRNGTPWDQNLVLKRRFRPLLRKLEIEVPRGNGFHALRHANSTLMDQVGVPLKVRQDRLGHVDARMTLGVYTHVAEEDAKRAASELGRLVWDCRWEVSAP